METTKAFGVIALIVTASLFGFNLNVYSSNVQLKGRVEYLTEKVSSLEQEIMLLEQEVDIHSHISKLIEHSHEFVLPEHSHETTGNEIIIDLDHEHSYSSTDHTHSYSEILNFPNLITESDVEALIEEHALTREPDFASGWIILGQGTNIVEHNLDSEDLLVYIIGRHTNIRAHQFYFGTYVYSEFSDRLNRTITVDQGVKWSMLDENTFSVHRGSEDSAWEEAMVIIWKLPTLPRVPSNR